MKRSFILLLPLVALLSGCIDTRNPIVAVRSFGLSVLENNLKDFKSILHKTIREEFGTQEKLDEYKAVLSPHEKLQVGPAVLIRVEHGYQGWGFWGDVRRLYNETLVDTVSGEQVMSFEVDCAVWMDQFTNTTGQCPGYDPHCTDQYKYVEGQDCRILNIGR